MFCQTSFDQWQTTIMQHLSHLSKPQATVLALWSFGMVLARSCALSAVSHLLAKGMQRKEQTVRQQLREWYDDVLRKRGAERQALRVETCFPLAGLGGQLVARHATGPGPGCHGAGDAVCRLGRQCGLSWLCHSCRLGGACPPRRNMPGGANGCGCCAGCARPSPRLDR